MSSITIPKAITILEERHAWVLQKLGEIGEQKPGMANYMRSELKAYEMAIDALLREALEKRTTSAARHAINLQLPTHSV